MHNYQGNRGLLEQIKAKKKRDWKVNPNFEGIKKGENEERKIREKERGLPAAVSRSGREEKRRESKGPTESVRDVCVINRRSHTSIIHSFQIIFPSFKN